MFGTLAPLAIGLGSAVGSKLLNPSKGYKKGQGQLDKYFNQSQQYLQPYNQNAHAAYGNLNQSIQKLLNPSQLHDEFLSNYNQSEASQMAQARAMEQGNRAAASTGVLGSTPHLQALQAGANEIGAQDQQNYIQQMIQQYMAGVGHLENIYGVGANAGVAQANNAMNMGGESANLAFGRNNANNKLFGDLFSTGIGAYGNYKGMDALGKNWSTMGGK